MSNLKYPITEAGKRRWLKNLRSGKFLQAGGSLRFKGGFCCLGVLDEGYDKRSQSTCDLRFGKTVGRLGFRTQSYLSSLNDDSDLSFIEIADIVEKLPLKELHK